MVYIISLMNIHAAESIGKSAQQIKACAEFIFNHSSQLNESLTESVKTRQDFKLVEKIVSGKSQFQFFPPKPQLESPANASNQEESIEKPYKIRRIF